MRAGTPRSGSPGSHGPAGSLRRRLLAGAALWITLALGCAGVALTALFRAHVEEEVSEQLRQQLQGLVSGLRTAPPAAPAAGDSPPPLEGTDPVEVTRPPADPAFRQPYGGRYWLVVDGDRVLAASRSWWDDGPTPALLSGLSATPGDAVTRIATPGPAGQSLMLWARRVELAGLPAPVVAAVGADATRLEGLTRRFAGTVGVSLAVLAAVLWAAAWLQVRQGLAPLAALQRGLQDLRAGRRQRLGGRHPAEVQPLVDDLDGLLQRHDRLLEEARAQAGDLAHALKTPLSVIGNVAADWPAPDGALVREQLERMQRRLDHHLVRARAAARRLRGPGSGTACAPVIDRLLNTLRRLHAARGLQWHAGGADAPLTVDAEEGELQEMLGNLLDNAGQWAHASVRLTLTGTPGPDGRPGVTLTVTDDGPGIPAAQRERVLERGGRLDERRPGHGLGLAIVDELARLHGGSLTLEDAPGGGLAARLWLPAPPGNEA